METLKENEQAIKEEQEELAAGGVKKVDNDDDEDEMDYDDENDFESTKKALAKFKNGKLGDDDDDYGDDMEDEDYEEAGGDFNLYDSRLDDLDELNFMKETMMGLMAN